MNLDTTKKPEKRLPLAVDLDGTIIRTDFFYESLLLFIKQNPFNIFLAIFWLISQNRGVMKSRIAERIDIDVSAFPYNEDLIVWLKAQKAKGRKLILATASHQKYAQAVENHLNLFDEVIATTGAYNIKGGNKEKILIEKFGIQGFDYVGDSQADLAVWRSANAAIIVTNSKQLIIQAQNVTSIKKQFKLKQQNHFFFHALQLKKWLIHTLIFIPLFSSFNFIHVSAWGSAILAFISFSLCASSAYIFSDLLNTQTDRNLRRTNHFTTATMSIPTGIAFMGACMIIGLILASIISLKFLLIMLIYLTFSIGACFYVNRYSLTNTLFLAGQFMLIIYAGIVAIDANFLF